MGGLKIADWLRRYAAAVPTDQAVVEVGCWLGGGTQFLVRPEGALHVYDRFTASWQEVEKAKAFGITLKLGENTLPRVKASLPAGIKFYRGEVAKARYRGGTIGLYVDDACKRAPMWARAMRIFERHFISGTILVLMDYDFEPCECQRRYAVKWELLERGIGDTCAAAFRVP